MLWINANLPTVKTDSLSIAICPALNEIINIDEYLEVCLNFYKCFCILPV